MKLLSIDIETLGTDSTSLILAAGFCTVDSEDRTITNSVKYTLDADSISADVDLSTLRWWLSTPTLTAQLKKYLEEPDTLSVAAFSGVLKEYIEENKITHVLVKSNSFEIPILKNLFQKAGVENPLDEVGFRNVIDVRTLEITSSKKKLPRDPALTLHCPLMDAKYQALNYLYLVKE